jgi:hypothetical protein
VLITGVSSGIGGLGHLGGTRKDLTAGRGRDSSQHQSQASKNVIHSAKVASYFRRSEEFGITKHDWKINIPAVRERKHKRVTDLVDLQLDLYEKSGAELVMGSGRFVEHLPVAFSGRDYLSQPKAGRALLSEKNEQRKRVT